MNRIRYLLIPLLIASMPTRLPAQTPAPPNTAPVELSQYQALVHDFEGLAKSPVSPDDARAIQVRFAATKTVRLDDGQIVTLDNRAIVNALDPIRQATKPKRLSPAAIEQVTLLSKLLNPNGTEHIVGDPHQQVADILKASEFRDAVAPKQSPNWWEEQMEKLRKAVDDFFRWFFKNNKPIGPGGGEWLAQLVQWLLILFAAVVVTVGLIYLGRWASNLNPAAKRRREGVLTGLDLLEEKLTDPLGSARELASKGEYRTALRLVYIASLRRLAFAGLLVLQENKTNWEYQRDLRGRSQDAYRILLPATRLFDSVWYGQRPATAEEYATIVAVHDALPQTRESKV